MALPAFESDVLPGQCEAGVATVGEALVPIPSGQDQIGPAALPMTLAAGAWSAHPRPMGIGVTGVTGAVLQADRLKRLPAGLRIDTGMADLAIETCVGPAKDEDGPIVVEGGSVEAEQGSLGTAMREPGCEPLPPDAAFHIDFPPSAASPRGFLLGFFGATEKPTHLVVVNLDYKAAASTSLVGLGELELFDAAAARWTSVNKAAAELVLPPGGGKLARLAQ